MQLIRTRISSHTIPPSFEHLYEVEVQRRDLHEVVTAFRGTSGRCNIHFANDAFEFILASGGGAVLASDIKGFFDNLNHVKLKAAWSKLLGVDRLPDDHYAVFRAVTKYCFVDRERLSRVLQLDPENPRADGRRRICSPREFRELVRGNGLCVVNRSGVGIPQGSPISSVLANLYMLEFDTAMNKFVSEHSGFYRRYCDDLLLVLPTTELREQAAALL